MAITVHDLIKNEASNLQLEVLAGSDGMDREIKVSELNRPGLALGGFFDSFRWERIQVIGRGEHAYLDQVALKESSGSLKEFFSFKIPCILLTHGWRPRPELIDLSNRYKVPLLMSALETATLVAELSNYLEEKISPTITMHSVLVDVYGLGVLISGDSGIGKSECALELIKRGHMLVSDDVVQLQHLPGGILIGKPANEMMKHHIEVRGLGIIDIKELFGMSAILNSSRIELVVQLEMWDTNKEYDRVGLEDHSLEILGLRVPRIIMPVRPGRNLAVLIEVSALHQRLKARGVNSAVEMEKNLIRILTKESQVPSASAKRSGSRQSQGRTPYRRR